MKTNRGFASCIALASVALVLLTAFARADTFTATFTNGFGDAIWTRNAHIGQIGNPGDPDVPGNWSTRAYPANGNSILDPNPPVHNVPGDNPLYDVVIDIATPCTLNGANVTVQSVAIGGSSTLNIASPRILRVNPGGTVNNQGMINLAGDLDFPGGNVTLTGGGTINFNLGRFVNPGTVTNVNNVIQGKTDAASGGLGNAQTTIINQANGVVDANVSGQPFFVYPGGLGGGMTNTGLMQASNGGILKIIGASSVPIANTGGTIQALTGSEVQLFTSSPGITGGTLATTGTGVIRVAASTTLYLTDVTNSGTFIVNDNGFVHLAGTINNTGSISLNATVGNSDISVDGNVTLTGGGTINMTKGSRVILFGTLNNVNNLIQGETELASGGLGNGQTTIINQANGVIDANIPGKPFLIYPNGTGGLSNAGTVKASNGGILEFTGSGGPITNTGAGTIQALNGSEVQLFNTVTLTGGTLASTGTGLFRTVTSGALTDLTNSATFITNNNALLSLGGAITNTGTMTFDGGNSRLQFHATTTFGGTGAVVLQNSALMYVSSRAVTNGSGHTIKGNGTILIDGGGSFTNNGFVAPGLSPGKLTVSGNYTQGSTGALNMELGGYTPVTQYDQLAVTGNAALGGTLNVTLVNGFVPAVGDVFQFITTGSFTGSFSTINTTGFTAQVNYSATSITMTVLTVGGVTPTPTPTPSKLLNVATRMRVQTGENVIIGGFIITGTDSKNVIIRGIGPSLSSFFSGVLANPTLELFQGSTLLQSNNDWKDTQRTEIEATGVQPSNDFESAIVRTLPPGSYTAILRGSGNTTGIAVVEAYDLNQTANSKLANIATRGFVEPGDNVMIGGFIIGPAAGSTARVVVRAIGPSLTAFGIVGALADPTVELKDSNGSTLSNNDDWMLGQPTEIQQLGLAPTDTHESALVTTLAPGAYTAIVRGVANTAGVGLVEVYHVQ